MKKILLLSILLGISFKAVSQQTVNSQKYTANNKGKFFVFWAGNRDNYTKSDIRFVGNDYDFTLYDVPAIDRPKGWHIDYINPARMTIPQTNFKMGYFISNKYNVAIGVDHMKYVMLQDVAVRYSGTYPNAGTFGETLPNNQLLLTEDFLTFEHTDGLNFVNTEFNRVDDISKIFKLPNTDKVQVNLTEGVGFGFMFPKTNAKILGKERYDDYSVSGYGASAKMGLNITFYKHFFIQTELKGGYVAEQMIFGLENNTTGVIQDLISVSQIAHQIVKDFGMNGHPYKMNIHDYGGNLNQFTFDETFENQAKTIIDECLEEVKNCLKIHQTFLITLSKYLSENSRISKSEIEEFANDYFKTNKVNVSDFVTKETYYDFKSKLAKM